MKYQEIIKKLRSMANPRNVEGMARYGINSKNTLGVSIYVLRDLARQISKDHALAQRLWDSGIHEARILACYIDDPEKVTSGQMEKWAKGLDSWDVCDQVCTSFFDRTRYAHGKAVEWSSRKEEFVKRAGFALMAGLAVHDRAANDRAFKKFLPLIKREAADERNYVKKAVNWALRNIGKRNLALNKAAIGTAQEIQKIDSRAARWIAADALRELKSEKVQKRLRGSEK
jgi:3-methyladenine DNA glycosylase AlkD